MQKNMSCKKLSSLTLLRLLRFPLRSCEGEQSMSYGALASLYVVICQSFYFPVLINILNILLLFHWNLGNSYIWYKFHPQAQLLIYPREQRVYPQSITALMPELCGQAKQKVNMVHYALHTWQVFSPFDYMPYFFYPFGELVQFAVSQ